MNVCVCVKKEIFLCILMVHMNECASVYSVHLSL